MSIAAWIPSLIAPTIGIVSAVVPAGFDSYVRVAREASCDQDTHLFESVAAVAADHTSTADAVVFGVWVGWGFDTTAELVWSRSKVGARLRRWRHRRAAPSQTAAALRRDLELLPRLDLPIRSYHLLAGPIEAATAMTAPPSGRFPQLPDLWWPVDRSWFVAGDTDLDWIYVAGTSALTDALVRLLDTRCRIVGPLDPVT